MHDRHDLDLIAGYADGSLEGDEADARRLIETCGECRNHYELQVAAVALLRDAPRPSLSGEERHRLRSGVLEAIESGGRVVDLSARRARRWMAVGAAAAVMVVAVGLGAALSQLQFGGSDTAADAPTTAAELTTAEEPRALGEDNDHDDSAPADTEAAEDDGFSDASRDVSEFPLVIDLGVIDSDTLAAELETAAEQLSTESPLLDVETLNEMERPAPDCLHLLTDSVYGLVTATVDGTDIEVYLVAGAAGEIDAIGFARSGCEEYPLD